MLNKLYTRLFRNVVHREMGFFDLNKSGEIVDVITSDADSLSRFVEEVDWTMGNAVRLGKNHINFTCEIR